ncbi:trypsin-like peptidase domain-containing protein [Candidatus Saccharibacteria bacterium]|nr:trypsin-like peptidase domain-containing protein [Candidatus Saccharibacteria bacterium]
MKLTKKRKSKQQLPPHPKKHHKPYRFKHFAIFFLGLMIGFAGTYKGGYIEQKKFDINTVSPASVKIYHFVCGTLKYNGQTYGEETCDGGVGTGFLVSSDGYIATSGHVVVLEPADIMVSELKRNPMALRQFIASMGVDVQSSVAIGSSDTLLSDLYDLPPEKLSLENKREAIYVSLGDRPMVINDESPDKVLNYPESDYIKKAELIAANYSPKDILQVEQDKGFSARDDALIKVDVVNAPFIPLAESSKMKQNDDISLIGFPADADNQLTVNDNITPSITNGNISSIRTSNGLASRLFQTDADASEGNSGGPAVNQSGEAFGVVTYRFKDSNEANAPKSYIRDIDGIKELLNDKKIELNTKSASQEHWLKGLDLASEKRYTKALEEYRLTNKAFPAHRLVGAYSHEAEQAIKNGEDIKDPPYALILTLSAIIGGAITVIISALFIVNHRVQHQRYKKSFINY